MVKIFARRMVVAAAVIIFAAGAFIYTTYAETPPVGDVSTEHEDAAAEAVGEAEENSAADETADVAGEAVFNVEAAMAPRILGDENAPVTIEEFASLTCSHCATFHSTTFPMLKEEYINTGKVRFTFTEFPLNAPALDASMVARCLPEDTYFKFISFLFKTQDDWAFDKDYRQNLVQNAKLLGLSGEESSACMENMGLRVGIITKMTDAQKNHDIKSTPSFLINDKESVTGAMSPDAFRELIDKLLPPSEEE